MDTVYVLCKEHPQYRTVTFICGPDPKTPIHAATPEEAAKFESIKHALKHRSAMPHQPGGTEYYRVHELRPDGRIIDVEG
jgi:hypothetical protein